MRINNAQRKVISNIFRDLTKLTAVALVVGQFVPGRGFNLSAFLGGLGASVFMAVVAIVFAVDDKEVEI